MSHYRLYVFSFVIIIVSTTNTEICGESMPVEKLLINKLINTANGNGRFGRPVRNSSEPVVVEHKLQLIQLLDLDENRQILVSNCWSNLRWKDELMNWDPLDFANITKIRLFPNHIWTPDILLYNFADKRMDDKRERQLTIWNDGTVLWVPQSLFKSTCSVEITYFPFDSQTCKLDFGSWTYDISQLDLVWWRTGNQSDDFIDHDDYMTSNEWLSDGERGFIMLTGKAQSKGYKVYRIDSNSHLYPVLRYVLRLKRNPSYYISILIVPCFLLSTLTLVIFWLPPESPAKLMLGMSIFVAFFVLLLLLGEQSPKEVRNFPLIGAYFCLNMIMITITTFLATLIINIHFRGKTTTPLPRWVRRVLVDGIGTLCLLRQNINLQPHKILEQTYMRRIGLKYKVKQSQGGASGGSSVWIKSTNRKFRTKKINADSRVTPSGKDGLRGSNYYYDDEYCQKQQQQQYQNQRQVSTRYHRPSAMKTSASTVRTATATTSASVAGTSSHVNVTEGYDYTISRPLYTNDPFMNQILQVHLTFERDVREINRYIRVFNNRHKIESSFNMIAMEYRTLAMVLDRLFCLLYIFSILVACFMFTNNTDIMKYDLLQNISVPVQAQ